MKTPIGMYPNGLIYANLNLKSFVIYKSHTDLYIFVTKFIITLCIHIGTLQNLYIYI